jgi:hypothetical protein
MLVHETPCRLDSSETPLLDVQTPRLRSSGVAAAVVTGEQQHGIVAMTLCTCDPGRHAVDQWLDAAGSGGVASSA